MHAQAVLSETFCAVSRTSIAYIDVGERLQIYSMSHLDSLRPCAVIMMPRDGQRDSHSDHMY